MDAKMLHGKRRIDTPRPGRLIGYSADIDSAPQGLSSTLDFGTVKTVLDAATDGDAQAMLELSDEMEARDLRLHRVVHTRRAAITGPEYKIEPAESSDGDTDAALAVRAADYVREELERITTFDLCTRAMSKAVMPNLSVVEIEWDREAPNRVKDFWPVAGQRLVIDRSESPNVRIVTTHNRQGDEMPLAKFVTHIPDDVGDNPFINTQARAQAKLFVMKAFQQMYWAQFNEVFGMPVRVAQYQPNATVAEKNAAKAAMADMGSRAWMLLSESMKYELLDVQRGVEPFSAMIEYLERSQAVGCLGQNLSTDTTGSGGLGGAGAAQVHQNVRRDITEEDMRAEERTLRIQLFEPMLQFRFPDEWRGMTAPRFRRVFRDDSPMTGRAEVVRVASQDIGIAVPAQWAYKHLNIPEPADGEAVLARIEPAVTPMGFGA